MRFPFGQTVTRLRRQLIHDPYSQRETLGDWAAAHELTIRDCHVDPVSSREAPTVDRDKLTTLRTLRAPHGADIRAEDRVRLADGTVWNVIGDPSAWRNPFTGWAPHMEISLERIEVRR